jgi:diguanylate cyclase (GGDEF)-like protein
MTVEQVRRLRAANDTETGRAQEDAIANGAALGIPEHEFTPSVRRAVWALVREARALRDAADRDQLLPILNRRAFLRELDREIASVARYRTRSSLVYVDIDALKPINDSYGHACGDLVLAHFARFLRAHVRASDVMGRLGGDEFGILLSHANSEQAERKCASLAGLLAAEPAKWGGVALALSFAFGLVELSTGATAESAVAQADAAMYRRRRLTR